MPTVSVIVPTRNRSGLLAQTLRSVLWQLDVDLEVLVVDEASTDDTREAIAAFGDARIRVIRNDTPSGVAAARNRGADEARGEWLAFVDDDDLWAPDKLARQLREVDALDRDWVYSGAVIIDAEARIKRAQHPPPAEATAAQLRRNDVIPGGASNVIVRRSTWRRVGAFDGRFAMMADWELYIRLADHGLPACVPSPLVARRHHPSNMSLDIPQIVREARMIEAEHHGSADWGVLHRWMAHSCLRVGDRRAASGQFARAAISGALGGVAQDLWAMFSRVAAERVLGPRQARSVHDDPWLAEAECWLQHLRPAGAAR